MTREEYEEVMRLKRIIHRHIIMWNEHKLLKNMIDPYSTPKKGFIQLDGLPPKEAHWTKKIISPLQEMREHIHSVRERSQPKPVLNTPTRGITSSEGHINSVLMECRPSLRRMSIRVYQGDPRFRLRHDLLIHVSAAWHHSVYRETYLRAGTDLMKRMFILSSVFLGVFSDEIMVRKIRYVTFSVGNEVIEHEGYFACALSAKPEKMEDSKPKNKRYPHLSKTLGIYAIDDNILRVKQKVQRLLVEKVTKEMLDAANRSENY